MVYATSGDLRAELDGFRVYEIAILLIFMLPVFAVFVLRMLAEGKASANSFETPLLRVGIDFVQNGCAEKVPAIFCNKDQMDVKIKNTMIPCSLGGRGYQPT